MAKFLIVLVIVAVLVFVFYARTSQGPVQDVSTPSTGGTPPSVPSRPLPAPDLPLQARVEEICARNHAEILLYRESPDNILELQVRGGSLQDVQQVLQDLQRTGILKDLFQNETRYTQIFVTNKFMHDAYYKIRT